MLNGGAKGKGKSYRSPSGRTVHYDEQGNKIVVSYESASGRRVVHYDADGKEVGRSYKSGFGKMDHYGSKGTKLGTSFTCSWSGQTLR